MSPKAADPHNHKNGRKSDPVTHGIATLVGMIVGFAAGNPTLASDVSHILTKVLGH
jgi:hypothetical protein